MTKVTLADVARQAGVGTATAERVLNGRGGVTPATTGKVVLAARKLDYAHRLPPAHREAIRIELVLLRRETPFHARLNHGFERAAASLGRGVVLHRTFLPEDDPKRIARHIKSPGTFRSALIIAAPGDPVVAEAPREVAAGGVPVVQVVTRPVPELAYVGIDNRAAGRAAAFSGSVVATCHSGAYAGHRERIEGFSEGFEVGRTQVDAGLAVLGAGGDFADGLIAYEGAWLGGAVFVSFDEKAVVLLARQGQRARLLA